MLYRKLLVKIKESKHEGRKENHKAKMNFIRYEKDDEERMYVSSLSLR